eukprot:365658-Chlamydomonas_euryale.AAC.14
MAMLMAGTHGMQQAWRGEGRAHSCMQRAAPYALMLTTHAVQACRACALMCVCTCTAFTYAAADAVRPDAAVLPFHLRWCGRRLSRGARAVAELGCARVRAYERAHACVRPGDRSHIENM